eukprot:1820752-Pleurochrysis_carterae.AAC.1
MHTAIRPPCIAQSVHYVSHIAAIIHPLLRCSCIPRFVNHAYPLSVSRASRLVDEVRRECRSRSGGADHFRTWAAHLARTRCCCRERCERP